MQNHNASHKLFTPSIPTFAHIPTTNKLVRLLPVTYSLRSGLVAGQLRMRSLLIGRLRDTSMLLSTSTPKERLMRSLVPAIVVPLLNQANYSIQARQVNGSPASLFPGGKSGKVHTPVRLLDEDIDERFVKGSGPGGQKINKVRNCVQLTHRPTGVMVSCQESRELSSNRQIARRRLAEKVEFHLKGDDSKVGRRIAKIKEKKARTKRKARLKHQGPRVTTKASAAQGETGLPPTDASSAGDWIERKDFEDDFEYGEGDDDDRGKAAN